MAKWVIDKVIGEFDYGHNVWTQELDETLSCNSTCKCKFRHGHRSKVIAYLVAEELTSSKDNMVIDFNDMKIMTQWMDATMDHKYLIDRNDPQCFDTFSHFWDDFDKHLIKHPEGYWTINPESYKDMSEVLQIKYESYVILDFVPTSENLARWMYDVMGMKMQSAGVKIHKIEWYETPKSRATYYGD